MIVELSRRAQADLRAIALWIGEHSDWNRADEFVIRLEATARELADMPLAFPLVAEVAPRRIRKRSYGRYLIIYRVERERIEVLRIVHGARDYVRLLHVG